jgi:hypothetical protein
VLLPTKHLDLNTCVFSTAVRVLSLLRGETAVKYDSLCTTLQEELGAIANVQFPLALSLLYLMGLAEYDEQADAVMRIQPTSRSGE